MTAILLSEFGACLFRTMPAVWRAVKFRARTLASAGGKARATGRLVWESMNLGVGGHH
jgi:hypothetical protein